jgi:hypothetical protein
MAIYDYSKATVREKRLQRLISLETAIDMPYLRPERGEISLADNLADSIRAWQHILVLLLPERALLCLLQSIEAAHPGQHHHQDTGNHGGRFYPGADTTIVNILKARLQAEGLIGVSQQSA